MHQFNSANHSIQLLIVKLHHTQQWTPQQHDWLLLCLSLILGRCFCRRSLCGRPTPCTPGSRLLTWFTSHFGSCRNGHRGCWFALPGLWVSLSEAGLWLPLLDTGLRVPSLDCPLHRPLSCRNFLYRIFWSSSDFVDQAWLVTVSKRPLHVTAIPFRPLISNS